MRNCHWKSLSACCESFWQPGSLLKAKNDVKLCLSTWVTLFPNMAERCRHKKCRLCFILFVYALLVHPLVGHMPNVDCVVCLWLWNIFVMILVTMNERQQVFRCKNIVALTYIFSPTLKTGIPYRKQAKKTIQAFRQVLYLYHFEGHSSFQCWKPSHVEFSTWDNILEHLFTYTPVISNNGNSKY